MRIVYDGGRQNHASDDEITEAVNAWKIDQETIPDNVAQAIAAAWHSPAEPETTALSTMGVVTADMHSDQFCTNEEFEALDNWGQLEILALHQYIVVKQEAAGIFEEDD